MACREKLGEIVPGDPLGRTYAEYGADLLADNLVANRDVSADQELVDTAHAEICAWCLKKELGPMAV